MYLVLESVPLNNSFMDGSKVHGELQNPSDTSVRTVRPYVFTNEERLEDINVIKIW